MKKLIIPKIEVDISNIENVANKLSTLQSHLIDTINWKETHPSKPEVCFRIAHNGDNLFLQYSVHENEILGVVTEDNGKVWTDSCVEFFVSFDDAHYYNTEATCTSRVLLGYRKYGEHAEHGSIDVLKSIQRLASLGVNKIEKQEGDFNWNLTLIIPRSTYWKSSIKTFDGIKAKGNFYKCGDNLSTPHFVSWNKIDTPKPSFHQPSFFGELEFGE